MIYDKIKRALDVIISTFSLILFSPLLLAIIVAIFIMDGRPILFRQTRPGLHGAPFQMLKFRTMCCKKDSEGNLLSDKERLTKLGRLLRKSSLDELPELLNVLRGDMSLVGPRPLLPEYMEYYTNEELLRHTVRPGLTGLAQVSGRNNLPWDDRLALDIEYVKQYSFLTDTAIIIRTIIKVIRQDDVLILPSTKFGKLSQERCKRNDNES